MRIWKRIICVEMFFVASVKKSSYLHTIVVASLEKKLAWLKVAKGGDCPMPGPALFEKWYESKYWSVLLFFLSAIWSLDSKKLKVLYPSYICCSNHVIKRLSVQQCTCHATSLMPLFWQSWIHLRLIWNKCFNRVLGCIKTSLQQQYDTLWCRIVMIVQHFRDRSGSRY